MMSTPRPARVLVVDDEPSVRELLVTFLEDEGYEVMQARNGQEALSLLERAEKPDLMLTDIMMPVMDGSQLLERMQAKPHLEGIAVVLMSAARTPGVGDSRVVAFLQKPFNLDMVLHVVERATVVQRDSSTQQGQGTTS